MHYHLLVIEKDNSFRESLVQRLRMESHKVYPAVGLKAIKRLIKRKSIDVVLLSLIDLKEEALEIMTMVRQIEPSSEVILLNANNAIPLSIKGMKLGAYDEFPVPLDFESLMESIGEAAARRKERRKEKKNLLKRYEEMMLAITMAESGAHDHARDVLKKDNSNRLSKKGIKNLQSNR